jgi:2-oxoglutarate dehydrogenase E1 component
MLSQRHLAGCIRPRHKLSYAGRTYSSSPASGYLNVHLAEQRSLVDAALELDVHAVAKRFA